MTLGRGNGLSSQARRVRVAAAVLAVAALLIGTALPGSAGAATITAVDKSTAPDSNNSAGDADAACSLREAVLALNQGSLTTPTNLTDCAATGAAFGTSDTVSLQPDASYTLTITNDGENAGATGDLDVTVDMTIVGDADDHPAIDENTGDGDRVLHVPGDDSLTLQSVDVLDGTVDGDAAAGTRGGNIYFEGSPGETLLLDDAAVNNGVVDTNGTQDRGGGIAADAGGQVTIQNNSDVNNNRTGPATSQIARGGGISLDGVGTDLTISNSDVNGNVASVGDAMAGYGGGIFIEATGDSVVNLTNAIFQANWAGSDTVIPTEGRGGALAASTASSPAITITGGLISQNLAGGRAGGGAGVGGGIYEEVQDEMLNLSGVTVSNNVAGGLGPGQGTGGGVYTEADTVIQNSTITGNDSGFADGAMAVPNPNGTGGGIYSALTGAPSPNDLTITGSTISNNQAGENTGSGGGIQMSSRGNLSITDSVVSGNEAGQEYGMGVGQGGGVNRIEPTTGAPTDSVLRSVIRDNRAEGSGFTRGGGMQVNTEGTFSIRRSTVNGNVAMSGNSSGLGGGLYLSGGDTLPGSHTVENTTIHGNTAQDNMTFAGGSGGGISVGEEPSTVNTNVAISHSTITANTAEAAVSPGGGNLRAFDGVGAIDLRASIVSGGVGDPGEENCSPGVAGGIDSQGFNVEGPPSVSPIGQCGLDQASDVIADPLLGTLLNNGGPMAGALTSLEPLRTRAITASSPAFDRVTSGCPPPTVDEIGTTRPFGGVACDSGAFELPEVITISPPLTPLTPTVTPPTSTTPTQTRKRCKKKRKATAAKKCRKKK